MPLSNKLQWTPLARAGFRFLFIYFLLYMLSNQSGISILFRKAWHPLIHVFGKALLGVEASRDVLQTGSGDGLYNYISVAFLLTLSILCTLVWSVLDKRTSYSRLLQMLVVVVRYYLIVQMALYGLAKVLYSQFPEPAFHRLLQPFGESSPMGLLWTFMGYSYGYNLFTGMGELLGAALLLFRRTTTLGALVTLGVMANVMVLNYCYDVPVKILSTHLVIFCLFLLALDGPRLARLFVLNLPTAAAYDPELFSSARYRKVKNTLKGLVMLGGITAVAVIISQYTNQPKPPLYGLYRVDTMVRNQDTLPPLLTDGRRWQHIAVEFPGRALIQTMPGHIRWFDLEVDTSAQWAVFTQGRFSDTLYYERTGAVSWHFRGMVRGDTVLVGATWRDKEDFLLMGRGFNWTNESPFNR
ncbi:MAG: hypothetical protein RIC19_22765 [Phaeodactylibacter sp.]|uniref:hypothetical protein n=1 Tax=Phaeodactylibacter sp. TaxID=1940289 RepID=UPI0032EE6319